MTNYFELAMSDLDLTCGGANDSEPTGVLTTSVRIDEWGRPDVAYVYVEPGAVVDSSVPDGHGGDAS